MKLNVSGCVLGASQRTLSWLRSVSVPPTATAWTAAVGPPHPRAIHCRPDAMAPPLPAGDAPHGVVQHGPLLASSSTNAGRGGLWDRR